MGVCNIKTMIIAASMFITTTASAQALLELTPIQRNLALSLIEDDVRTFITGGETMSDYDIGATFAEVDDIVRAYDENQVAGDLTYFGKRLLLTGEIASINSGIGNRPYIVFKSATPFGPQAHFDKNKVHEMAKLKKGQELSTLCIGDGAVGGIPMFKNCESTERLVATIVDAEASTLDTFLAGGDGAVLYASAAAVGLVASEALANKDACAAAGEACTEALMKFFRSKEDEIKTQLEAARLKMKDAGLIVDTPED